MEKPMAPDERDRMFDKALARHLRSATPAREEAGMPGVSASQSSPCPDPETLAAYHERSLFPQQLNSLKEHIVGCANCQTVLAHLEMTDEIPLQAAEEEQVFAQTVAAPAAAVSSQSQAPSPKASRWKSRRTRLLRGARWQWLAPAGAIAAGLLVWIAFRENRPLPLPLLSESESKMAKNEAPPPVPSGATRAPQSPTPAKPSVALARPESSTGKPAIATGARVASQAAKQTQTLSGAAGAGSADSQSDDELRARNDRQRDALADQLTTTTRTDRDAKNLPDASLKKQEASSRAANVQTELAPIQNSQAQNQSTNYAQQRITGPNPSTPAQVPKAKTTAAPTPAPSAPSQPGAVGGVAPSYSDSLSMKVAHAISDPRLISPPGSGLLWRAGRRGLIEFSKDGGSSWSRQTSGVLADLLAGSAPSVQVCWIVGQAGAVLRTIDGGAHWKAVAPPLIEDLGGIRAMDALHATIWNARGTKSFETSDGGLTWKAIPNP